MRIRQNIRYEKLESPNDNNGKYHLKTNALCYFLLSVQVNIVIFFFIDFNIHSFWGKKNSFKIGNKICDYFYLPIFCLTL